MRIFKSATVLIGMVVIVVSLGVYAQSATASSPQLLFANFDASQNTVKLNNARLPKWQRVRDWMVDGAVAHSDPALAGWASWAASLRGLPVAARLDAINRRVNTEIRYATDFEIWGVRNHWGTPSEIVLKGATDCKGFAIMKFWLARLAGLDDGELALLIGILPSTHQMHAVLLVATTGTPVVLDNRHADVVEVGAFGDFRPVVAGDLQGLHLFVADPTGAGRPIEVAENHPISAGRPKDR